MMGRIGDRVTRRSIKRSNRRQIAECRKKIQEIKMGRRSDKEITR